MFFSPPRRKLNNAQSLKASEASASAPLNQTVSLGQTIQTVPDHDMSEADTETQVPINIEPVTHTSNIGFPMGAKRGRGSRTTTPTRTGSDNPGLDQNYSVLERRIETLTTQFEDVISQQNELLERLLPASQNQDGRSHVVNRVDPPLTYFAKLKVQRGRGLTKYSL